MAEGLEERRETLVAEDIGMTAAKLAGERDRLAERRNAAQRVLDDTEAEYRDLCQRAYEADHVARFGR
jgi:hypothetical protein